MLHFLRKHQKYFFFVITVVVIMSFSFFGTYDTLSGNAIHEQIAFTTIEGTKVTRADLDAMVNFITTDNDDKRLFGGAWGPNFLNDGVIRKDILETGLAEILVAAYPNLVASDLESRLEKEKRYSLYAHPQAPFLSTEAAWEFFAPTMKANYRALRRAENPVDPNAFSARVALYANERRFPAPLLRQVLRYQQKQQGWLQPDPNLDRIDLSLFGYHTLEDWFGPRFTRMVAEFIMNSSQLALQKGYQVTKTEALADLMHNAEISFQQNINSPHLGVANSAEYMNEQLRLLGMDRNKAVKVWQQVLLFRRLFQDVGNATLVDILTHQKFNEYAQETVTGDLYRLPPELRLKDYRTLQKFEMYLYAVTKRPRLDKMNDKEMLSVPTVFLALDEVKKKYPELVQKQYTLEVAQANKNALQAKIGLKEMWNWEAEDKNWALLKKEFPILNKKPGETHEERIATLDSLDDPTRAKIDAYARTAIVEAHPEWLETALKEAQPKQMTIGLSTKGSGNFFITGLTNREELIKLLDDATPNAEPSEKLTHFTGNNIHFYRIKVIERKPNEEILTFTEANREGILDQLLDQILETHYSKIRDSDPDAFQKEDKSWKAYADVKDRVADQYFEKLLKAIQTDAKEEKTLTGDRSASLRFYAYMRDALSKFKQGAPEATSLILTESKPTSKKALNDQWKLEKSTYKTHRSTENSDIDPTEMFSISQQEWTSVQKPVNGDLYFFQSKGREKASEDLTAFYDNMDRAHGMVSDDAQRNFMHTVVSELKAHNSITLDYMNNDNEIIEETSSE